MTDSSEVDAALVALLRADAPLAALLPDGVYFDAAPAGSTRFVRVTLDEHQDVRTFGGLAYEDAVYLVEAITLLSAGGDVKAGAARIHALLDGATLTAVGYETGDVERVGRTRAIEEDEIDVSIRWLHRGGRYRLRIAPAPDLAWTQDTPQWLQVGWTQ